MAQSYVTFTGNGSSTGPITLGFNYILKSHVKVYESRDILLGTGTLKTETTHYTFNTAGTQISMVTAPANGVVITVERETPNDDQIVAYADGSNLIADSLNNADKQTLFTTQELEDRQALAAAKALAAKAESETATSNVATLTANPILSGNFGSTAISVNDSTNINLGSSGSTDSSISYNGTGSGVLDIDTAGQFTVTSTGDQNFKIGSAIRLMLSDHPTSESLDGIYCNWPVVPGANDTYDLGTDALKWQDIYIDGTAYLDTANIGSITGSAVVTTGTSTSDTQVYSAKHSDDLFLRQDTTELIKVGVSWSGSDTHVASAAAIDARIINLVDDVGGFVPIDNENSFPATNPDIDSGSALGAHGTILSIQTLNTARTSNGSGVITITNGTGSPGATVTLTGCGANKTFAAGFGMLVETTATLHTYKFHRYVPQATDVTTVATNISNINAAVSNQSNINSAVSNATNINTVATNISNVNNVAGISADVTAVAGDAADIGACSTNIGSIAAIGSDLANNFENITDYGPITGAVTSTSGTSDISTLASGSNLTNIATVSGISANVTTVAGISADVTAVANDATDIGTCASNISAITGASTQATNAAASATAAASSQTAATASEAAAAASATSSASSASTSTAQAAIATTQATNAAASASTANTHQQTAKQYRDDASGIKTQAESNIYNLSDSVSSHTAWGNITDTGITYFSSESGNVLLTMSKGSAVYDYGAVA